MKDATLETGLISPLEGMTQPKKKTGRQKLAEKQNALVATPRAVIESRLKYLDRLIERAGRIESFEKRELAEIPGDLARGLSFEEKFNSREQFIEYLKTDRKWYETQLKRCQDD